ncbi:hypothetical protein [Methylorubrum populi]|uniref:hypothetical protein n=1 Tax=Methylorubrum populi TaxID=223967 RepID=UPI0012FF7027|nr:hypothetical protein [Methylorubrum populi]
MLLSAESDASLLRRHMDTVVPSQTLRSSAARNRGERRMTSADQAASNAANAPAP